MAALEGLALELGGAVVKGACKIWLKESPIAAEASGSVVDLLTPRVSNAMQRHKAKRQFDQMIEVVGERLQPLAEHEFRSLPDNEREAAILAVRDTFERAVLDDRALFDADLDSIYLDRHLREQTPQVRRQATLSRDGQAFYDRLLRRCCAYLIELTTTLPDFQAGGVTELLRRDTLIIEQLHEVLDRLPQRPEIGGDEDEGFEVEYRQQVARKLDRMELFGASVSDASRDYPLSVAYISLHVLDDRQPERTDRRRHLGSAFGGRAADHREHAGSLRVEDALADESLVFIRGDAGSGKSTLLKWLAVSAARHELPVRGWDGLVPFFVQLRSHVDRELPAAADLVQHAGRHIADEMPAGWVQRLLRAGRALVLVDGVDELPERQREDARAWLRELVEQFPRARYVVTSRPGAVNEKWLDRDGFAALELASMGYLDVRSFVAHWHEALRSDTTDTAEQERLTGYERRLTEAVEKHRHLRALAANPLLCALVCALHRDRHTYLPRGRMEVYEAALEMLLERRDVERHISDDEVSLSRTEKTLLLQNLAYWLLRNGWTDVAREHAVERFAETLATMHQVSAGPERVFQHLRVRSGLLREPVEGRVDFVHRTFQEYLAGKAAVETGDTGVLARNAHDDQWRETIIMAAGWAGSTARAELLRGLLARAEQSGERRRDRLHLVALGCLETSPELPPEIRTEIESHARRLLPPKNMGEAEALVPAGEFVLEQLADRPIEGARQAAATIRAASTIGGDAALRTIARCAAQPGRSVDKELKRAWTKFDPEQFARTALSESPHLESVDIDDPAFLPALRHIPALRRLMCIFLDDHGDLSHVMKIPQLISLNIIGNQHSVDLSPLTGHENLSVLLLQDLSEIDISSLAALSSLERLFLSDIQRIVNVESLGECTSLSSLILFDSATDIPLSSILPPQRLTGFGMGGRTEIREVGPLTEPYQLTELQNIELIGCTELATLGGIEHWADSLKTLIIPENTKITDLRPLTPMQQLKELDISGTSVHDIDPLQGLSALRALHLRDLAELPELSPLRWLESLEDLYLAGNGSVDLKPLVGKTGLTVYLNRGQQATGVELLGEGSKIKRI